MRTSNRDQSGTRISRRTALRETIGAAGCGWGLAARAVVAQELGGATFIAPRLAQHTPKATRLIIVFLTGGVSHVDTFDPKPELIKRSGEVVPAVHLSGVNQLPLLGSQFAFQRCGAAGLAISELFPCLGSVADELCVIRSMHTDIVEHFQATLAMHTGSATVPMPSLGAWLSYGLGTSNANLPAYMVLCEDLPYAGSQVWDSHFLPPIHQGVRVTPGPDPIPDLVAHDRPLRLDDLERKMLSDLNQWHAEQRPGDLNLLGRQASYQTARGMMRVAPEILDLSRESVGTLDMYGITPGDIRSVGWQCLVARRMIEEGVRVVEIIDSGSSGNWDAHANMGEHRPMAKRVDRPLAALIRDLRQRGLLDDTLVAICTEFGRTPWTNSPGTLGRNHYARAFSSLLVGGGVRGGMVYGETDELGATIAADPCHVHDYHATMLHLLGIDHTQLTYRYAGRDFRLTDVHGNVLHKILS